MSATRNGPAVSDEAASRDTDDETGLDSGNIASEHTGNAAPRDGLVAVAS